MGSSASKIPQPYRWYHPHMSWLDMLFNWIFPYLIMNFNAIAASDPTPESSATSQALRDKSRGQDLKMAKGAVQKWSQTMKCPIAEVLVKVPRRPNLLREWKLTEEESFEKMMPLEDIGVRLFVPVSILNASLPLPEEDNELGCKQLEPEISFLKELPENVPLVVAFHGGGMNQGEARNGIDLDLVNTVSALQNKPLIFASVEYSLVPEHPFPVPPVEGMTVLSHFLDLMPNRQLHVSGSSAGAYMATVSCMETIRRYPGRISSLTALCPMMDPLCDTESYYMNGKLSFVTAEWLRWCWQAFLGLPRSKDTEFPVNPTLDDVYKFQSNRTTYNQSRWKGSSLERLARPIVDIPKTGGLKIIITSNMADPLRQDSMQYAAKLKEMGAKVTHLVHSGSHGMGTFLDSRQNKELAETWHRALFE